MMKCSAWVSALDATSETTAQPTNTVTKTTTTSVRVILNTRQPAARIRERSKTLPIVNRIRPSARSLMACNGSAAASSSARRDVASTPSGTQERR